MLSLSLETVPSLNRYADIFSTISIIITTIFVAELVLRLIVTEHPLKYLTSFYGIVDLVAILPALVGADTKSKQINDAVIRLQLAFHEIKRDLLVFHFWHSSSFIFLPSGFTTLNMKLSLNNLDPSLLPFGGRLSV